LLNVRKVAEEFARLLDKKAIFTGEETDSALLSNAQLAHRLYGPPRISLDQLIHWTARWIKQGGQTLGKPTHFETRDGKF
jgi:hypothetical protein